jgi:hypothetical protein
MAVNAMYEEPPSFRCESPSPRSAPAKAIGADNLRGGRYVSMASSVSRGSSTDGSSRDSSDSRQSSASFQSREGNFPSYRHSTGYFMNRPPIPTPKRRGYTRPEATDFAASAKHRDSVLSLGSIAHLQYYFARTGLLDGKGAQLSRKRNPRATLDFSQLDSASLMISKESGLDLDSSYTSLGTSPDAGQLVESPTEDEYFWDDCEEPDPNMLPPTTSTYKHREKVIPKPPTLAELKADLTSALRTATKALVSAAKPPPPGVVTEPPPPNPDQPHAPGLGWYGIQGMQILDVMTLAIRAAKVYYTSHEHPERLDAIKSEKEIRSELLAVMEVLKHMATRSFAGGMRDDELATMNSWIAGIHDMLAKEDEMEAADREERHGWTWLKGDWNGREISRELAFLRSMDPTDTLPAWTPVEQAAQWPTPFLESMQNGLRLVTLHNAAVRKSTRRFGAIGSFHTDTQKPYRCADNLRYWAKAAELRWEVLLKIDALGIVYNNDKQVWVEFEEAIWKWCRTVREEIQTCLEKEEREKLQQRS